MLDDVTVILPTLNEEGNISRILEEITKKYPKIKIIVADDGSKDRTQAIVKSFSNKHVELLDRFHKQIHGLGESVMDACLQVKTTDIIVMDADFQHPVDKIKDISILLKTNDIVIAVRRAFPKKWSLTRKIISVIAQSLIKSKLSRKFNKINEPTSGFFGIKASLFKSTINRYKPFIEGRGYKILFNVLKYSPKNIKIGYTYYEFGLRKSGYSKINSKQVYYLIKSLIK